MIKQKLHGTIRKSQGRMGIMVQGRGKELAFWSSKRVEYWQGSGQMAKASAVPVVI